MELEAALGAWETVRQLGDSMLARDTLRMPSPARIALAAAYVQLGQAERGRSIARGTLERMKRAPSYNVASASLLRSLANAWAGDITAAFTALHDAFRAGHVSPDQLRHDPFPEVMRADPRFPPLLAEATRWQEEQRRRADQFAKQIH